MTGGQVFYSDEERERLRRALQEHLDNKKLSYQELANDISDKVNYGLIDDSGRRRVERFLKGTHRQNDDFIHAIARYLGSVPPPMIEESAATLADFFSRSVRKPHKVENLIGRYRVYASTDRRAHGHEGFRETMTLNQWGEFSAPPIKPMISKIPYAVIDMKPMPKYDALLVSETIFNFSVDPETDEFPDMLPRNNDAGVIVAFGYSDRNAPRYFMATRTVLETRLYRLYKVSDDPLTLRGELSFNGGIGRPENMTHSDPLHPEYEVELVRISDLAES
ncbi:hypothetical protein [Rhodophyticola porphyridii]|uniref:hypothetical protein n=1 Tax=Rhodophyticola porphyridii TaxID=1852017 RepID=UPI0035D00842